jgi:tetratricopeptide (TPR) repeat protein
MGKIRRFILLAILCVCTCSTAIAAKQSEWTKLTIAAEAAYNNHELKLAESNFRAAAKVAEANADSRLRLATTYFRLAFVLQDEDKFVDAEKYLKEAIKLENGQPDGPLVWQFKWKLAQVFAREQKYSDVEEILLKLIKTRADIMGTRGGDYWLQLIYLSEAQLKLGKLKESELSAEKALDSAGKSHNKEHAHGALMRLGLAQRKAGKLKDANASFTEALRFAKDLEAYELICEALKELGITADMLGEKAARDSYFKNCLELAHSNLSKGQADWLRIQINECERGGTQ